MSYILDALKKADAEREREAAAVPDLYAQADALRGAHAVARPSRWALLALAAVALVVAASTWRWFIAEPDDAAPPAVQAQAPAPLPVPPPLPAGATPTLPAPAPAPAPAPLAITPPAVVARSVPRSVPAPAPQPRAATIAAPLAVAAPAKPAAVASAASAARLPGFAELPPDLRSQLPALAVGGSVYSPNAASRIVILNGQVFREGDRPVEGLSVEQIRLKSTVLVFRGARFELKH